MAAAALGASPAWADCADPAPALVWSYPAQGATGVPTNADLWVQLSGWYEPSSVSLNGAQLAGLELSSGYDLGELAPNTEYTLDIQGDGATFELTFTTGSGPVAPDASAAPGNVTTSRSLEHEASALCQSALNTQGCFDTGQNTYYEFAPSGSAVGWLIAPDRGYRAVNVWPGECGAPRLFGHDSSVPCVVLHGIDASGATHAGERVCATEADAGNPGLRSPVPASPQASGCALSDGPSTGGQPFWALALLGLAGACRATRSRGRGLR